MQKAPDHTLEAMEVQGGGCPECQVVPGLDPNVDTACSACVWEYSFQASSVFRFAARARLRKTSSWPVMDCPSKTNKGTSLWLLHWSRLSLM